MLLAQFDPCPPGVKTAVKQVNELYHTITHKANLSGGNSKPKNKIHKEQWFDKECDMMRKNIRQLSNQKHRQPNNPEIRENYCKKLYKQMIQKKKQTHYNTTLEQPNNPEMRENYCKI